MVCFTRMVVTNARKRKSRKRKFYMNCRSKEKKGLNGFLTYSQTSANDHLPTNLKSQLRSLYYKSTSEQRPPVNNGHKFGVPRVVVVHKFDCISKYNVFSVKAPNYKSYLRDSKIVHSWTGSHY